MSKQTPLEPIASPIGPCPTIIQIIGCPGTNAPPDHPNTLYTVQPQWLKNPDGSFSTAFILKNGWMDDLRFYVLFNSVSVISGRWADDNERVCAMEPRLRLGRFCLERGSNPGPLDQ